MTEVTADYQGFYSRLMCGNCEELFEIEGDVHSGQVVECDLCGTQQEVTGR